MESINSLFSNLLDFGVQAAAVVAACYVAWGGFLYLSAAGGVIWSLDRLIRERRAPELRPGAEEIAGTA